MASANNLSIEGATEMPTGSPTAKSAKVDAVNRKMFASCPEWSDRAAAPSANGTMTPDPTVVTNSTTEDVRAIPIALIMLKSARTDARETDPSQPARQKLRMFLILVHRIVKMNANENLSENANASKIVIPLMEV